MTVQTSPDSSSPFASRDWARELDSLVATLPRLEATALHLAYVEHLDSAVAAVRIGLPLPDYQRAVALGLRRLGSLLSAPDPATSMGDAGLGPN